MDFHRFLRAIRKSWWVIVLVTLAAGALAAFYGLSQAKVYASNLTFYVGSPAIDDTSANATNQFAQDRAVSYARLIGTDRLAALALTRVQADPSLPAAERRAVSVKEVAHSMSGSAELNTVLIDVSVTDTVQPRAVAIARAVGAAFPELVDRLDNRTSKASTVKLSVVSGPSDSHVPIAPHKTVLVEGGLAIGLLLGLAIAVLRELLDVSIRSSEALAAVSGLPVLGSIAFDRSARSQPLLRTGGRRGTRAEAIRQIRTSLYFMDAAQRARTVVMTSSVQQEGKSTITANLALSVAESGRRTILVDADLRRPRVETLFSVEGGAGLTNVLVGELALADAIQPYNDHLSILTAGISPPNPAELLGSEKMHAVLADLAGEFDLVLIDSPPVLPVTDAALLAAGCDGVIVVFRHGKTRQWQLRNTLRALDTVGARVLGCVLNMRPVARQDRSAYSGYYSESEQRSLRDRLRHPFGRRTPKAGSAPAAPAGDANAGVVASPTGRADAQGLTTRSRPDPKPTSERQAKPDRGSVKARPGGGASGDAGSENAESDASSTQGWAEVDEALVPHSVQRGRSDRPVRTRRS